TREASDESLRLLNKSIELDPDLALGNARAAFCYVYRKVNGWMVDRALEGAEAVRLARRAIDLGRDDAVALSYSGFAAGYLVGTVVDASALVERALAPNTNLAVAWVFSGWIKACLVVRDTAIKHTALAMRLSPLDPRMFSWQSFIPLAHLCAARYDEAAA